MHMVYQNYLWLLVHSVERRGFDKTATNIFVYQYRFVFSEAPLSRHQQPRLSFRQHGLRIMSELFFSEAFWRAHPDPAVAKSTSCNINAVSWQTYSSRDWVRLLSNAFLALYKGIWAYIRSQRNCAYRTGRWILQTNWMLLIRSMILLWRVWLCCLSTLIRIIPWLPLFEVSARVGCR